MFLEDFIFENVNFEENKTKKTKQKKTTTRNTETNQKKKKKKKKKNTEKTTTADNNKSGMKIPQHLFIYLLIYTIFQEGDMFSSTASLPYGPLNI